jgi:glycosyltransferase involved in cell wall biosynthesis
MTRSVGIAGPIQVARYLKCLDEGDSASGHAGLGMGMGGTQVNAIALELLERGYTVFLYTLDPRISKGQELRITGKNLVIHVGAFPRGRWERYVDLKRGAVSFLSGKMKADRPDIVHAHWTGEYARAAINSGLPYLVSARDWMPAVWRYDPFTSMPSQLAATLEQMYVLGKAKNVSPNSEYIRNKIGKLCAGRMVETIPNFIAGTRFQPVADAAGRFPEFSIVSINNGFGGHKNVRTLLRAFRLIRDQHSSCRLYLAGTAHEHNGVVHRWAREEGLEAGVVFMGELDSTGIDTLFRQCWLLVHPSLEESFGNTLIEAMVREVPVVGGRHSGAVPWVLNYGDAGILANVKSPESIAAACIDLIEHDEKRSRLAKQGFSWAYGHFSSDAVMPKLLKLYSEIQAREQSKQRG